MVSVARGGVWCRIRQSFFSSSVIMPCSIHGCVNNLCYLTKLIDSTRRSLLRGFNAQRHSERPNLLTRELRMRRR